MQVIDSYFDSLEEKINLILEENKTCKQKIEELEKINTELKVIVKSKINKITELEKEIIALKINEKLEDTGNSGEIKKKINEMVREIDKCIAYLNN